jgi:hypothetical protein
MSYSNRRDDRMDSEPPLTLDDRRRGPRARGPAPVTLILSLLLLVVVVGGVFFMYRSGVRGAGQPPQPLGAPLGDVRAPAPPQTQTPDAAAGLTISKDDPNAPTAAPRLAPPPEAPLPEAAPAPATSATASSSPAKPSAPASPPAKAVDKGDPIDRLIAQADKPKAAPAKVAGKDVAKDVVKDAALDPGSAAVVQIGAFSSETLADKEWSKAAAVAPGAMAGKGKRVVAVTKDGATLYRTAITGFASREQAQSLCDRLQAAGANCFVR